MNLAPLCFRYLPKWQLPRFYPHYCYCIIDYIISKFLDIYIYNNSFLLFVATWWHSIHQTMYISNKILRRTKKKFWLLLSNFKERRPYPHWHLIEFKEYKKSATILLTKNCTTMTYKLRVSNLLKKMYFIYLFIYFL